MQKETDLNIITISPGPADQFLQEVKILDQNIDKIGLTIEEIKKLHEKILVSPSNDNSAFQLMIDCINFILFYFQN